MLFLVIHSYDYFPDINWKIVVIDGHRERYLQHPHASSNAYKLLKHIIESRCRLIPVDIPCKFRIVTDEETENVIKILCKHRVKISKRDLERMMEMPLNELIDELVVNAFVTKLKQ